MPYKDPAVRKAQAKLRSSEHYLRNREARIAAATKRNKEFRSSWAEYKATLACTNCGFSHPAAIDFHHPPGTKTYAVRDLVQKRSLRLLKAEIAKCIILCSNCHRIYHYNEFALVLKKRVKELFEAP